MERVAFLIEETNTRLSCMLNPESLLFRRQSGVALPDETGGRLAAGGTPRVVFTGGGVSEMELDLLFDVSLSSGGSVRSDDVREYTAPIWELSQNSTVRPQQAPHPPYVRFVWGKAWNVRALVRSVAERLENFNSAGRPRRSWLRLRLLQMPEQTAAAGDDRRGAFRPLGSRSSRPSVDRSVGPQSHVTAPSPPGDAFSTDRLDQLAQRYYQNCGLWRPIAEANNIQQPDRLAPGVTLTIPALARS